MVTKVTPEIRESIDWHLDGLVREWEYALDTVRHLNRGDSDYGDPEDLSAEWYLAVDHLVCLLRYQQQGMFSSEQERQFRDFQRFMSENKAELETVLGPGGVRLNPAID